MARIRNDGTLDTKNSSCIAALNFVIKDIDILSQNNSKDDVMSEITSCGYISAIEKSPQLQGDYWVEVVGFLRGGLHEGTDFMLAITDFLFWTPLLAKHNCKCQKHH